MKCLQRVAVGYRCKECLGQQRIGYYNASPLDYTLAAVAGLIISAIAGFIVTLISGVLGLFGFILIAIFAGPAAGAIVAEGVRAVVGRRRGRYLWLVACAAIVIGGLAGALNLGWVLLPRALLSGEFALVLPLLIRGVGNLAFWLYAALAVSAAYYRLRV
jgi:hypothetical protein